MIHDKYRLSSNMKGVKGIIKLIETIKDRCHECYACVRNCPAKAVRVKDGQAEVISERCIHCGNCVRVCAQGAKRVKDYLEETKEILNSGQRAVAGLAPSFPSFDSQLNLEAWLSYLKYLGFDKVYEVAWGAQIMVEEYKRLLEESRDLVISTACPVIVNLIKKYYPELVGNLAPIVSPMMALTRYIKKVENPGTKIVLIGPCLAKKGEFEGVDNTVVLTFSEIITLGKEMNKGTEEVITNPQVKADYLPGKEPEDSARRLPLTGGLIRAVTDKCDYPDGYLKVEGSERVFELLNSIIKGEIKPRFVDILFCEGCINGVDLIHENYFKKENAVNNFVNKKEYGTSSQVVYSQEIARKLDLSTAFTVDSQKLPQPAEEEIWEILNLTGKYKEEDLLNCGACGYNSCREKAIAVYQGLAEVEMCLPYLLSEKRSEIKKVQQLNRELDTLINSSYDGLVMVSGEGRIEKANQAYLNLLGLSQEDLIGKKALELEKERIIYPSIANLCLHEKREITLIQNTRNGQRLLTTARPLLDEKNNILRIVVNARNLTKLNELNGAFKEGEKLRQYLEKSPEIDSGEGPGHIISNSDTMKNILKLAQRVGDTDSSVLIMGESGVGKEVIARYIHEQSPDRESLVKINCAAIPESLLESELFGYETGAFSGAKREGKPGLIEKADGGTLFLDEIGEMPLNMQAKLLQVLQEHRVTRIGGVEPIEVDFRLICATNRDLKEMVANKDFREDLYYRLNVVPIYIPPLRERPEDILPLVNYFLSQLNKKYDKNVSLGQEAKRILIEYSWPGNVRELSNLLERVIITTEEEVIEREHLEKFFEFEEEEGKKEIIINNILPLQEAISQVEKKLLLMARESGKTTYDMAELLGVNQSTIVRKLKKYFG